MSVNPMFALLDATAREGQRFAEQFFREVDTRNISASSIIPATKIVWNGTPLAGLHEFNDMINRSPTMKHEITGLDVQPFANGDANAINMIVDTSGKVKIGTEKENNFAFSAQLIVRRPQPGVALVTHAVGYRLVHKSANSTLEI